MRRNRGLTLGDAVFRSFASSDDHKLRRCPRRQYPHVRGPVEMLISSVAVVLPGWFYGAAERMELVSLVVGLGRTDRNADLFFYFSSSRRDDRSGDFPV